MNCRNCGYSVKHSTDGYCINCGTKVRGGFFSKLFNSQKKSENRESARNILKSSVKNDQVENWESPLVALGKAINTDNQDELTKETLNTTYVVKSEDAQAISQTTDTQEETPANVAPKPQKEEESVLAQILTWLFVPWWARGWWDDENDDENLLISMTTSDEHDDHSAYLRSRGGTW